jgi:ribulose-phosphate 3-epimerase
VDYLHIDCNDNPAVFDDIREIRDLSDIPVDLHIISSDPEKYYQKIAENNVEMVTFQYENLKKKLDIPADIKSSLGLSIISSTDISVFEPYKDKFDFILFMTTVPGQSGFGFDKETFRKIRKFRLKYPDKRIHVDGGVTADISFVLRNMGVDAAVSGSYLVNSSDVGGALHNLRNPHYTPKGLLVRDIMLSAEETPVLKENFNFSDVLLQIEKYNLGFTLVSDNDGKLSGLISNADVRRGLIRHLDNFNAIKSSDILNRNPIKIYDDFSVSEMLDFVKNIKFNISFLPVVDRQDKITGAITFTNLIKGE